MLEIRPASASDPPGSDLLEAMVVELTGVYGLRIDVPEMPRARRRGLARELLTALERTAREMGYVIARLDTGPRQPQAQSMYERAGYEPVGNFNANPIASFWGEKRL